MAQRVLPGLRHERAIDLRKVGGHPLASVSTFGLRYSWCAEAAPMPRILALHALPPAAKAEAPVDESDGGSGGLIACRRPGRAEVAGSDFRRRGQRPGGLVDAQTGFLSSECAGRSQPLTGRQR
jgi:hypothetical protein